jgi:ribose transport system permease protein
MSDISVPLRDAPLRSSVSLGQRLTSSQAFWITLALLLICGAMALAPREISAPFTSGNNLFNTSRNFAFIAIMALGQTAVIITGGIDLSVGSIMGVVGIVLGLMMDAGHGFGTSAAAALLVALLCGAINGYLIAYMKLSPFVVTLGMLSIARSAALVVSNNRMIYQFGPDEAFLLDLGGGSLGYRDIQVPNPVWAALLLTVIFGFMFRYTLWGRHIFAIGGNEQAARLTGIAVNRVKLSVYLVSALTAGIATVLTVGWLGSVTNALGTGNELRVIAASVIGGANLIGGEGTAYGALIGAALIEVIRNALLLAGVDPYWQGTFIGAFIILAVLLERLRGRRGR